MVTKMVDVYALGGALLCIMSGHYPWDGLNDSHAIRRQIEECKLYVDPTLSWSMELRESALHIPIVMKNVIKQLLAKEPQNRISITEAIQLIQSDSYTHLKSYPYF